MTTNGINLINLGLNLDAVKHSKGSDLNDLLIQNQVAAAYLALVQAFCNAQDQAEKRDAKQTDDQVAKGQATAEVVASLNETQAGHSHGAGQAANGAASGNGALGAVGGAAK